MAFRISLAYLIPGTSTCIVQEYCTDLPSNSSMLYSNTADLILVTAFGHVPPPPKIRKELRQPGEQTKAVSQH